MQTQKIKLFIKTNKTVESESWGRFRKNKKTKDPNAPKKPQSAYFLFINDRRPKLKETHPDKKVTEMSKLLGAEWKDLSADKKKKWEEKAETLKAEYQKKLEAYKKTDSYKKYQDELKKQKKSKKKIEESDEESESEKSSDEDTKRKAKKNPKPKRKAKEESSEEEEEESSEEEEEEEDD
ncbi:hypothetical protein RFI_11891 [Reticulomyxa filosa]|uniref:HMG box domain-containing protein n=1 Tax=Reticulomyxa filosa TaxID=46433 RepID=X6NIS0_RETFI|nr:hypothetical protein RFI_11891 [Reticulomyxa filosa]|eukprot:ETO25247.1 hypothetical protein RFI_11891 [Reticulomyxa filosa]